MNILLFGARGYLGSYIVEHFQNVTVSDVDIADFDAVSAVLDDITPDVVINTAGKTGRPNVDWCEKNKDATFRSNARGPLVLFDCCAQRDIYLVHVSSGCVYQGDNSGAGYSETDPPNFFGSFYARSKAWSDYILKDFETYPGGDIGVLVARLRMPFDNSRNPRSLISKITTYDRVLDTENSISYLPDFFDALKKLIEKRATGVYNITNPGVISPYRIVELYKEIVQPDHQFERLSLEDLGEVAAAGRSNCMLNTDKLKGEGIELPEVEVRVREALEQLKDAEDA